VRVAPGHPSPLGATWDGSGVNFALRSSIATRVEVCLFDSAGDEQESRRVFLPGRTGGVRLSLDPAKIRLGDVVRRTELNMDLVECFDPGTNTCPIIHSCGLKRLLMDALDAFVGSLNAYTLADILKPGRRARLASSFIQLEQLKTRKAI